MGREKRIAESRARAVLEKSGKQAGAQRAETPSTPAGPGTAGAPPAAAHTGTGKAILQILALYLVPVIAVILIGKLIFHL
jgi:hypothetical protein